MPLQPSHGTRIQGRQALEPRAIHPATFMSFFNSSILSRVYCRWPHTFLVRLPRVRPQTPVTMEN